MRDSTKDFIEECASSITDAERDLYAIVARADADRADHLLWLAACAIKRAEELDA